MSCWRCHSAFFQLGQTVRKVMSPRQTPQRTEMCKDHQYLNWNIALHNRNAMCKHFYLVHVWLGNEFYFFFSGDIQNVCRISTHYDSYWNILLFIRNLVCAKKDSIYVWEFFSRSQRWDIPASNVTWYKQLWSFQWNRLIFTTPSIINRTWKNAFASDFRWIMSVDFYFRNIEMKRRE